MQTVRELMTPRPTIVRSDAPISEAARQMVQLGFRHLPVVDSDRALVGIITDAVVFRHGGFLGFEEPVWVAFDDEAEAMTCGGATVEADVVLQPDADLVDALSQLAATRQDVIVVVDEQRVPLGIATEHDVVRVARALLEGFDAPDEGTAAPVTIARDAPARDALALMEQHGLRHVLVVDEEGALFGVLAWGDLVADDANHRPEFACEDAIRTLQVIAVREGAGLHAVAHLMAEHHIGCIPACDEQGRPRRVFTRTDVLRAVVRSLRAG